MDDFEIKDGVLIKYHGNESTVHIPEGVTEIDGHAFHHTLKIERLILPESVKQINFFAMYSDNLKSITYDDIQIISSGNMPLIEDEILLGLIEVECPLWVDEELLYVPWAFEVVHAIHDFLQNPEIQEHQKLLKHYILGMILYLDSESFRKVLYTGKIYDYQKIDDYIRYANMNQAYEKQIILMNYKSEYIGYDSIENSIQKKFDL